MASDSSEDERDGGVDEICGHEHALGEAAAEGQERAG